MSSERDIDLVNDLRKQPAETPWLEFKSSLNDHDKIGHLISALSNSARLEGKESAFLVWGIEDGSHNVVGTTFDPFTKTVGNQVFEFWLKQKLSPAPVLQFRRVEHPDGKLILLEIPAPTAAPTSFEGTPFIRVGSATPGLPPLKWSSAMFSKTEE
ncbi:ATP-binding protein, partial [Ruegeria sp.]|uniref:AlbA family DNA-binding domain-containing protein n=1 Tax=Ruegeria sp. TaxID=1879320 RepID=UPI00231AC70D